MTEPRKIAIVFLVVMFFGLVALAWEWFREKGRGWLLLIGAALVALIMVLGVHFAHAQEHRHPPEHQDLHEKFYSNWMMPDNRNVSCCHGEDCKPAQSRRLNGKWQSRHSDADEWTDIPEYKIETERDSPDGRSHLCGRKGWFGMSVFCFLPAAGG